MSPSRKGAAARPRTPASIETKDLTPARWPAFEALFGQNGACGGCWCMAWRVADDERWADVKGPVAKARMKKLVASGKALGVLAFAGDEPVGWCAYGRRTDFPKLGRARTLACDDADRVWSIPCFFVKRGFRGQGVATAMLEHAVCALAERGAEVAEGYPVKPDARARAIPAAFAWTGTRSLFAGAGFKVVGNPDGAKQRVRRKP
jgi:GNAT superfamily N-acetyltransferase